MAQENPSTPDGSNRRSNTEWRERQQKKKVAGYFKLFAFMVFMGVFVGLGIAFKKTIYKMLDRPMVTVIEKKPERKSQKPSPDIVVRKKAPEVKPDLTIQKPPTAPTSKPKDANRGFDEAEEAQARKLIAEGLVRMEQLTPSKNHFDFMAALDLFKEAATLRASKATHDEAASWIKKVPQCVIAVRHIEITKYATVETAYRLTPTSRSPMVGLKISKNSKTFKFRAVPDLNPASSGKITLEIPLREIQSLEKISLDQRKGTFRQLLLGLESELNPSSPEDFYDLVFLSKRLGLAKECIDYLDRAYAECKLGQLGNRFRKLVVDRAIERASLRAAAGNKVQALAILNRLVSRTLPGDQLAQDEADAFRINFISKMKDSYKSTIALKKASKPKRTRANTRPRRSARDLAAQASGQGEQSKIVVSNPGIKSNAAASGIVAKANKEYELGMGYYKQFRSGNGAQRNAALKKAAHHLGRAVDMYGQAIDKDPGNTELENIQQQANMIRYGCMKYLTL